MDLTSPMRPNSSIQFDGSQSPNWDDELPDAAYLHIPFCRRRCYYCDFPISVVGDRPPLPRTDGETTGHGSNAIARYVDVLCDEISVAPVPEHSLHSIFFGGGTPSLLSVLQLERILSTLSQKFVIDSDAELSIEMDPGTFTQDHINGYVSLGINRVSLGVQAFQSELLKQCGRTHTPDDITAAIDMLRCSGLENYSLDLISGLPHQTLDQWHESLEHAIALNPTHISVYDLTLEKGTAFGRWYQPGSFPLPSDTTTVTMYRMAQELLTQAGYVHYEISNYAKPGYECRHNRVYWENRPYYGFGMGATSYVFNQRFSRPRTQASYGDWVNTLVAQKGEIRHPCTSSQEALLDTLMVGLRLAEGLDLNKLRARFGDRSIDKLINCLRAFSEKGWISFEPIQLLPNRKEKLDDMHSNVQFHQVRLTDPDGFLFSNVVLAKVFAELDNSST